MSITRNLTDLVAALEGEGLPVAQIRWFPNEAPDVPYCVLRPLSTNNVYADGVVKATYVPYYLYVYTQRRDIQLERTIQGLLDSMGIAWSRDTFEDFEGDWMFVSYSITLIEE